MRTSYKTLSQMEYNVLNKIASYTKMDCWFSIKQDKHGIDYIYDLEERKRKCLKTGVKQLMEGVIDDCMLYNHEIEILTELLQKLKIKID